MQRRTAIPADKTIADLSQVRLLICEFHQDDPKKCTAAKLRKFRLASKIQRITNIPPSSVVLNPVSTTTLSKEDSSRVKQYGLVALDCSWNRASEAFSRRINGENRRLPTLIAGNPTNYGAREKLTTAEAFSAALYITGFVTQAKQVLSIFKWGRTFLTLNMDPLNAYAESPAHKVAELEGEFFQTVGG